MEASQEQRGVLPEEDTLASVASYNSQYIPPRGLPAVKNAMKASQEQGGTARRRHIRNIAVLHLTTVSLFPLSRPNCNKCHEG